MIRYTQEAVTSMKKLFRRIKSRFRSKELQRFSLTVVDDVGSQVVEALENETILKTLTREDIDISYYCGGNSSCGTCRVKILDGKVSQPTGREKLVLGVVEASERLACQARVGGDIRIEIIHLYF